MAEIDYEMIDFSNRVQDWAWKEEEKREKSGANWAVTVGEAADHFACPVKKIIAAVRSHYWMYLELPSGGLADDPEGFTEPDAPISYDKPRDLRIGHEGE